MQKLKGGSFAWGNKRESLGFCAKKNEVFEYLRCFWHKPNGNTGETPLFPHEETQASLQKIRDAGNKVSSMSGFAFRKLLRDNPDLKNELSSGPYVKNSPINIRDALYRGRTDATKIYYRVNQGKKSIVWMWTSLYPYIWKYGKFPVGHRKFTWLQTLPLTVWRGHE